MNGTRLTSVEVGALHRETAPDALAVDDPIVNRDLGPTERSVVAPKVGLQLLARTTLCAGRTVAQDRVGHQFVNGAEVAFAPRTRLPLFDHTDRIEPIGHAGSIAEPADTSANGPVAYDAAMTPMVLTLIGDDRAGLVNAIAEAVTSHGGNWERSQMAELAGKFAGIVLVTIPDDRVDEFTAALDPLQGLLDVTVQRASADDAATDVRRFTLDLLGADRPGIISDITATLVSQQVNIESLATATREAPMGGGLLFEATAELEITADVDVEALRSSLEALAGELMVDIDLDAPI